MRKCREHSNYSWTRGSHNIFDERLVSAIDIEMDEGILSPDKLHVSNAEVKSPWTQFMALKVNIRTERNPTVRKVGVKVGKRQ